jgi:hypothetical protein
MSSTFRVGDLTGSTDAWDREPSIGTLSLRETTRLCAQLGGHTATPERCWFGIGEGYADLPDGLRELTASRLQMRKDADTINPEPLGEYTG